MRYDNNYSKKFQGSFHSAGGAYPFSWIWEGGETMHILPIWSLKSSKLESTIM